MPLRIFALLFLVPCALSLAPGSSFASYTPVTIEESDGTPSVKEISTIKFANGTVTDDGNGVVTITNAGGSGTVNTGVQGYFGYYPANGTTIDDQTVLYTNGTNVGIGTTSTSALLHLRSASDAMLRLASTSSTVRPTIQLAAQDGNYGYRFYISNTGQAAAGNVLGFGTGEDSSINGVMYMTGTGQLALGDGVAGNAVAGSRLFSLQGDTGSTTANVKNIYASNEGTFNTTSGALTNYSGWYSNTATRASGANALTNVGLYATATGAQNNYAAIFEAGNVGIGTTGPANLTHVYGSGVYGTPLLRIETSNTSNPHNYVYFKTNNGSQLDWSMGVWGSNAGQFSIGTGANISDASKLVIQTDGNVGIGTTSPAALLNVRQDSTGMVTPFKIENRAAETTGMGINLDFVGIMSAAPATTFQISQTKQASGSEYKTYFRNYVNALTTPMMFGKDGADADGVSNVGIGYFEPTVDDPAASLHVQSKHNSINNTALEVLRLSRLYYGAGAASGFGLRQGFYLESAANNDAVVEAARLEVVLSDATDASKDGELRFYTVGPNAGAGSNTATQKMTLDSGGNLSFSVSGATLTPPVKTDTGDPTGAEGAIYYNTFDNKFRCYQGAAWTDCISAGGTPTLDAVTAAAAAATRDHAAYEIDWQWNSLAAGNGLELSSSADFTGNLLRITNSNNSATNDGVTMKITNSGATNQDVPFMITQASDADAFRVNDDGTDADSTPFIIAADGNVGIGTTTASYPLHVQGTAVINPQTEISAFQALYNTAGTTGANRTAVIGQHAATYTLLSVDRTGYAGWFSNTSTRTSGSFNLTNVGLYATASGAQNNYAAIFEAGNVGIGTTAPANLLHLYQADPNLDVETTDAAIIAGDDLGTIQFRALDAGQTHLVGAMIRAEAQGAWDGSDVDYAPTQLQFFTEDDTATDHLAAPRMVIDKNGLVGIGTSTPAQLLDIFNASGEAWIHVGTSGGDTGLVMTEAGQTAWTYGTVLFNNGAQNRFELQVGEGAMATSIYMPWASGNVGIGSTTPAELLDVAGRIKIAQTSAPGVTTDKLYNVGGALYWAGTNLSSSASKWTDGGADTYLTSTGDNVGIGSSTVPAKLYVQQTAAADAFRVDDVASDTTPFVIDANGNVGIGTTDTATYKLTVSPTLAVKTDASSRAIRILGDNPNYYTDLVMHSTGAGYMITSFLTGGDYQPIVMDGIDFRVNAGPYSGTHNEKFRVASDGNVGIGTTAPAQLLDVYKSQSATTWAAIRNPSNNSSAASGLYFGNDTAGTAYIQYNSSTNTSLGSGNSFNFEAGSQGGPFTFNFNGVEKVRFKSDGNVGIGTTSPNELLELSGNMRLTLGADRSIYVAQGTPVSNGYNLKLSAGRGGATSGSGGNLILSGGDAASATSQGYVVLAYDGTNRVGKVGVGMSAPVAMLDVLPTVNLDTASWKDVNIGLVYNGETPMTTYTGAYLAAPTGTGTITNKYALVTESGAGNVGIGTTTPTNLLHTQLSDAGTNSVASVTRLDHITSGTAAAGFGSGMEFYLEDAAGNNNQAARIDVAWEDATNASEDASIRFNTMVAGTLTETMRIDDSGNVGIGTSAPRALLHSGAGADTPGTASLATVPVYASAAGDTAIVVRDSTNDVELTMASLGGTGIMGTATGHDLSIRTSNNNRIAITNSSGNVDITTDAATLRIPRKAAAGDPTGATGAMYYDSTNNKFRCYQGAAWTDCISAGGTPSLDAVTAAAASATRDHAAYEIDWQWNTLAAGNGLELSSSADFSGTLLQLTNSNNSATNDGTTLKITNSGATNQDVPLMITNASDSNAFRVNDDGTDTDSTPFVIKSDGNVGIGTTDPTMPLMVTKTQGAVGMASFLDSALAAGERTQIQVGKSHSSGGTAAFGLYNLTTPVAWIGVYGDDPASNVGFFVQQGGNVGIGSTVPAGKLQVVGQMSSKRYSATASINWNNGNTQSITLTNGDNGTISFSNPVDGGKYTVLLKQPSSGGAGTVSWDAKVRWSGGSAPTLTTTNGRTDAIGFIYRSDTDRYLGVAVVKDFNET